jgi:hypothetical protein
VNSFTLALQHRPAEKAPAIDGRDKLSRAGRNVEFSPSALQHLWGDCRAEHPRDGKDGVVCNRGSGRGDLDQALSGNMTDNGAKKTSGRLSRTPVSCHAS